MPTNKLDAVVKTYRTIKRPRAQRVVNAGQETGEMLCKLNSDLGHIETVAAGQMDFLLGRFSIYGPYKQGALEAMHVISQDLRLLAKYGQW